MAKMSQQQAEAAASRSIDILIKNQPNLFAPTGTINPMLNWEGGQGGTALANNIRSLHAGLVKHFLSLEAASPSN